MRVLQQYLPNTNSTVQANPIPVAKSMSSVAMGSTGNQGIPGDLESYIKTRILDETGANQIYQLILPHLDKELEDIVGVLSTVPYLQKSEMQEWWNDHGIRFIKMCKNFQKTSKVSSSPLPTGDGVQDDKQELLIDVKTFLQNAMLRRPGKGQNLENEDLQKLHGVAESLVRVNPTKNAHRTVQVLLSPLHLLEADVQEIQNLLNDALHFASTGAS
ncbi:hypothetical protein VKT23_019200 [Stygiomarasmius scandens]|uniref:Uncharacterized protein n=1 Tax=Marasmiellus scandens TaxID=2682957 RepID=A0ABR1IM38_9AGAR